ncbi:CD97 antigen isoform X2 [Denticeps clupeoides]|uniref:CD97 antigen isoform X2 n=1 Tax=Denticeps clupeoides TaxID=299321 RepID=UPI0010A3C944|nr:CD97 antigen-like isoform X2 [Denticeps clupeoides]
MGTTAGFWVLGVLLSLSWTRSGADCPPGYSRGGNDSCSDFDECSTSPCGNHSECRNTQGSYYCYCQDGFGTRSGSVNFTGVSMDQCKDVNECQGRRPCLRNQKCVNLLGSFRCDCAEGYGRRDAARGDGRDEDCFDVDECRDGGPGICGEGSHNCSNAPGSYVCLCRPGYSNYGNTRTMCTELRCDGYDAGGTLEQTVPGLDRLWAQMKENCMELSSSTQQTGQVTGKALLENVLSGTDELVSGGRLGTSREVTGLLRMMEKAMMLIGPQLQEDRTKMETEHTEAKLAVSRSETPPTGHVRLSTENATLTTSWNTVIGNRPYPGFAVAALVTYKNLEVPDNSSFEAATRKPEGDEPEVTYKINSRVVTACVSNPDTSSLPEPVTLTFRHVQERAMEQVNYSCVFWDDGTWSRDGCQALESNVTHTVCSFQHLSSFAVLMALYPIKDTFELHLITWVGLTVSLVCLAVCIITFKFCRTIHSTRTTIHLHLSLCLFFADLIFLCGITSTQNQVGCAVVAGLLHYCFLAAFCWMLLEGVQLYRMVVLVFHSTLRTAYMLAVGYGAPLLIIIISASVNPSGYGTKAHCWLSLEGGFIWSFFGPVCVIVFLNACFFIITVWKLAEKLSSLNPELSSLKKVKGFTVTAVAQLCVLGGMWVFGCFLFQERGTTAMAYLFTLLNSLQGALIFFMHCLLSKAVREEYGKFLNSLRTPQKKRYSEFSTNQSSNYQQPLRSVQSTGESQL